MLSGHPSGSLSARFLWSVPRVQQPASARRQLEAAERVCVQIQLPAANRALSHFAARAAATPAATTRPRRSAPLLLAASKISSLQLPFLISRRDDVLRDRPRRAT